MTDSGAPENPAAEETSTPAEDRPTEDLQTKPAGATGDDVPDAAPATAPEGAPADEATPADAGAGAATQAEPAPEPEPEAVPEPDPIRDPIVEQLRAVFGDDVLGSDVRKGDMTIRVTNAAWHRTAEWAKAQGFTYFCFLSGIDWLPDPEAANRYENTFAAPTATTDEDVPPAERTTGYAGGDTRFQVFVRLYDVDRKLGITLKADLDDTNPTVQSIADVFRGADWHEREAWEMFGFDFAGHPDLRHLYLPGEFEGFPMRKDFPLLARAVKPWPGLVDKEPIPGEDEEEEAATPA
jgi:NADH-quinone oxidoreductase subunit C